jgi:hypothetical protein
MPVRYLLSCSCGKSIPVESRQAGGTVTCACGQTLQAPSLRGLREMPVVQDTAVAERPWGMRQGGVTLCIVLAVVLGGVGAGLWQYARSQAPAETADLLEVLHERIESFTPRESYLEWILHVRDTELIRNPATDQAIKASQFILLRRISIAIWIVAGLFLLSAALFAFWPRRAERPR